MRQAASLRDELLALPPATIPSDAPAQWYLLALEGVLVLPEGRLALERLRVGRQPQSEPDAAADVYRRLAQRNLRRRSTTSPAKANVCTQAPPRSSS
jgi:hypothetical protein